MTRRVGRRLTLRRRLAIAFVVTAGMAAGGLAVGSALVASTYRTHAFRDRVYLDARQTLAVLEEQPGAAPNRLVGGPEVLLVRADGVVATSPDLTLAEIPVGLRRRVQGAIGEFADASTTVHRRAFTVVGTATAATPEAYFFFGRDDLEHSIRELRLGLLVGWVIVVVAAAAVGTAFARRVLRPVADAADAARTVASGLLDLPPPPADGDEFARWAGSFDSLATALEQKITALAEARDREQRFNADIAHDLRTPLGSVLTAATLLEQHADRLPEALHRPIALVVDGARRLRTIADDLLELHRLEAGVETAEGEDLDVVGVVRAAVQGNGWDDRVTVTTWGDTVACADPHCVDRITVNLLANALKHGGGVARVVVEGSADHVAMSVADDGPGIAPEALPHLFDRYYTAPASGNGAAGGTGLGLAIALEQAHLLGGELTVESTPGSGARFTLRLPRPAPLNGAAAPAPSP